MSQTKWIADPLHSEVNFKVKHLMISTVKGQFKDFSIEAETDDNDFGTLRNLLFTAEVNSINTNNAQRDAHLKSADFFHAEQNPQIKFVGKKYEINEKQKIDVEVKTEQLTIKYPDHHKEEII